MQKWLDVPKNHISKIHVLDWCIECIKQDMKKPYHQKDSVSWWAENFPLMSYMQKKLETGSLHF